MSQQVPPEVVRCAECDEAGRDEDKYEWLACIDGMVYGPCGHPDCGGVCEAVGPCRCRCHQGESGDPRREEWERLWNRRAQAFVRATRGQFVTGKEAPGTGE